MHYFPLEGKPKNNKLLGLDESLIQMRNLISEELLLINRNIRFLQINAKKMSNPLNQSQLIPKLNQAMDNVASLFQQCKQDLLKFHDAQISSLDDNKLRDQLHKQYFNQYMELNDKFQQIAKEIAENQKSTIIQTKNEALALNLSAEQHGQIFGEMLQYQKSKQEQKTDEQFLNYLVTERQKELDKIQTIMINVNSVTQDLAVEVKKQDEYIENISDNIKRAKDNTRKAYFQLTESEKKQQQAHGKSCFLIGCLIVTVIFVVLIGLTIGR